MTAHIPGLLHIVEKDTDHTPNTQIYHLSHSWLVTGTSIKSLGLN